MDGEDAIRAAFEGAEEYTLTPRAEEAVEEVNRSFALVFVGGSAVVVQEALNEDGVTEPRFLKLDAFKTMMANRFAEVLNYKGERKWISWARLWLAARARRQYTGITFAPDGDMPDGYYNLWRGFSVEPVERPGAYRTFTHHLFHNVCGENAALYDWVFGWIAHVVQRPAERLGVSLVLRGKQGCGKTKVGEVFGSLFREHYRLADDPRYITGQFNAHMKSCLLLQADEGFWAGDKQAEGRLKGLVTSSRQFIELKGVDPIPVRNLVHLMITSNHDWVVPAGAEERRFAVLDVGDDHLQDHPYFARIDAEMDAGGREALLYDLMRFDLSSVNLRRIPATEALFEQKIATLSPEEAWWFDRLAKGTLHDDHEEWLAEVPKRALLASYIKAMDQVGVKRRSMETTLGMALKRRLCPGIVSGKVDQRFGMEGEERTERVNGYKVPPLDVCRAAFAERLGWEVPWNAL